MTQTDIVKMLEEEAERAEDERDSERDYVRIAGPNEPAQVYSLRLPADRLDQLREFAARYGEAPSTMMRRWVLDRLDSELSRTASRSEQLSDPGAVQRVEELLAAVDELLVIDTRVGSEAKDALREIWLNTHRDVDHAVMRLVQAAMAALIDTNQPADRHPERRVG